MPPKKKHKIPKKRRPASKTRKKQPSVSAADLNRLEFHRNAMALMPDPVEKRPGIAVRVEAPSGRVSQQFCSCTTSKSKTCPHLKKLARVFLAFQQLIGDKNPADDFTSSVWNSLAGIMADGIQETPQTVSLKTALHREKQTIEVFSKSGSRMLTYFSNGLDRSRFLERCTVESDDASVPTRGTVIQRLSLLTLTDNERILLDQGFKSRRHAREENFWYRFAYHCYREWGTDGYAFYPAIEEASGEFVITCKNGENTKLFAMNIPRGKVKRALDGLHQMLCNHHGLTIHPIPLDSLFDVKLNKNLDLEIRPLVRFIQKNGEAKFFERKDLKRFQYGDLIYIKELGILAEDQYPKAPPKKFREPIMTVIKKSQVPSFLEEFKTDLKKGPYRVDQKVRRLKILKHFEKVEIRPEAINRDWCWLSVRYGAGNQSVSLAEILQAKQAKQRFIATADGWVDCQSPDFDIVDTILDMSSADWFDDKSDSVKLSRSDIFRISAAGHKFISITGDNDRVDVLKKLLALRPPTPIPEIKGMTSPLRAYQKRGTEWLWFLFENGFGGLLCDDMGLGKTHQVMAFLVCLQEQKKAAEPFLVVSPTTVISHWHSKIREHAPSLKTTVYHGDQRDLIKSLSESDVLLTSYGILRRDINKFKPAAFSIAVFDEIQNIKNPETQAYAAAKAIKAPMKLGLTGTPIENTLNEFKALMDLAVFGYLGTDDTFKERYVNPIQENSNASRRKELSRLISPFTLRRLKKTVLNELPDKIEDLRTCTLSEDQVKLYRDAIASRAGGLLNVLEKEQKPIPYIHIFALLNLLKQICNHPALVKNKVDNFLRYRSGKWDLFTELISESLDSGQKVVVYSQYLGMIDIIKDYLENNKIVFVSLTGSSRNRGDIVDRFNNDPDCRVFVGSLKAGGTGIDLVAASVVIHYDRWWNAAREDQATDRVHRIGQKRGVQVFKLVTEGTLEEKIAAIIEKKRNLMDSVVKEDDPGLLKTFSREELIGMLSMPDSA